MFMYFNRMYCTHKIDQITITINTFNRFTKLSVNLNLPSAIIFSSMLKHNELHSMHSHILPKESTCIGMAIVWRRETHVHIIDTFHIICCSSSIWIDELGVWWRDHYISTINQSKYQLSFVTLDLLPCIFSISTTSIMGGKLKPTSILLKILKGVNVCFAIFLGNKKFKK